MNRVYLDSIIFAADELKKHIEDGKNLEEYVADFKEIDNMIHNILDEVEDEQA